MLRIEIISHTIKKYPYFPLEYHQKIVEIFILKFIALIAHVFIQIVKKTYIYVIITQTV